MLFRSQRESCFLAASARVVPSNFKLALVVASGCSSCVFRACGVRYPFDFIRLRCKRTFLNSDMAKWCARICARLPPGDAAPDGNFAHSRPNWCKMKTLQHEQEPIDGNTNNARSATDSARIATRLPKQQPAGPMSKNRSKTFAMIRKLAPRVFHSFR